MLKVICCLMFVVTLCSADQQQLPKQVGDSTSFDSRHGGSIIDHATQAALMSKQVLVGNHKRQVRQAQQQQVQGEWPFNQQQEAFIQAARQAALQSQAEVMALTSSLASAQASGQAAAQQAFEAAQKALAEAAARG